MSRAFVRAHAVFFHKILAFKVKQMMMMMNVANMVRGALNGVLIYFSPDIHSVCQL